jgi:hypothetical protein
MAFKFGVDILESFDNMEEWKGMGGTVEIRSTKVYIINYE